MENEFNIYNTLTGGSIENIKLNQKKENTEVPHSSNNIVEKTFNIMGISKYAKIYESEEEGLKALTS